MRSWQGFVLALVVGVLFSGCVGAPDAVEPARPTHLEDPFAEEQRFAAYRCDGFEAGDEWVGPPGPNGPTAPPGWQDLVGRDRFTVAVQVFHCDRIAWGALDRGPVWFALEIHNRFNAPRECTDDLTGASRFYIHRFFSDDPDVVAHAEKHGLTAVQAAFSWNDPVPGQSALRLEPEAQEPTVVTVTESHVANGTFGTIETAYLWARDDVAHRLAVVEEGNATLGDLAVVDWGAPMILSDRPSPAFARISSLFHVVFDGDMTTYADLNCTEHEP